MILFFKVKNLTKHLECYRFYLTNLMKGSFSKTFFLLGMSFTLSLNAEIQHSGFLGGPFHGVSRDVSGSIVNRVGTAADLVDTIGLVAHSDLRSIEDGESAHLQAALRLDDGTITKINARDVQWSTESDKLSIADGLATARNVGKRTRVAILASTDRYSATIFVRLKPGQTPVDAVDQFELPRALANAVDLELPGWKNPIGLAAFIRERTTGFITLNTDGSTPPVGIQPVLGYGAQSRNGSGPVLEFIPTSTVIRMHLGFISWCPHCPVKFISIIPLKFSRKKNNSLFCLARSIASTVRSE